jgi:hypothetical protein
MLQNILDLAMPEGVLVDRFQLRAAGLSQTQIDYCVCKCKIQSVAKGVYRRPGPPLKWQCVVHSLVKMGIPCRVASVSALQKHGLVDQKNVTPSEIVLARLVPFPKWLKRLDAIASFRSWRGCSPEGLPESAITSFPFGTWDWPIPVSTPELALLELLAEIHSEAKFHIADQVFRSVDFKRLKELLVVFPHYKARRLCLWFAQRHGHIDLPQLDIGYGKIAVIKNGVFDKALGITVPRMG